MNTTADLSSMLPPAEHPPLPDGASMVLGRDFIFTFHPLDNVIDVDFASLASVVGTPGPGLQDIAGAAAPGRADDGSLTVITNTGMAAGIPHAAEIDAYVTVDEQAAIDADNVVVLGASAPLPALDP